MNPPKGYYRQLIGSKFPDVRIAFTHTPIYGCIRVDPTSIIAMLDGCIDPHAKFYANGLRNGELVTIVEKAEGGSNTYKNNGELFFKS